MAERKGETLLPCRLLIDEPLAGAWNMAVDEALLESAAEVDLTSLRFYRWSEPTLSLGYFQNYDARKLHRGSRDCPVVRRGTGGGAIVHDQELTYSLAIPVAHPLAQDATWLYRTVHEALLAGLVRNRIWGELGTASETQSVAAEPFLCFQRRGIGDVLVNRTKVCGSAQRRRRGAILQHGSLLLAASPIAPELPGLFDVAGVRLASRLLLESWTTELVARLNLQPTGGALSAGELDRVRTLTLEKYDTASWNRRR